MLASFEKFRLIPGNPLAYWISEKTTELFRNKPLSSIAKPRQGMATTDNEKFLRLWHEIDFAKIGFGFKSSAESSCSQFKWFPYNKEAIIENGMVIMSLL